MKIRKLSLVLSLSLILSFSMAAAAYAAAEELPLGPRNFTIKLDYIDFNEKELDTGYYVGFEGFSEIGQNFYLGAEIGYVNTDGKVEIEGINADTDVVFIPIELNLKYALKVSSHLIIGLGGGASYNFAKEEVSEAGLSSSIDEWLFGGQVFTDINFKVGQVFLGVNAKYQITDNGRDIDHDFSNWRVGGQIGVMF